MLYPSLYLMYLPSDCHVIGSQYIYIFFFLFFFSIQGALQSEFK